MTLTNKTYRGSAGLLTLASTLTGGVDTIQVGGDVSGWPTGADGRQFVLEVDQGVPGVAERILCSALAGSAPATITVVSRGYDGTTDQTHQTNAKVLHVLDADAVDELVLHVVDEGRDDHEQYLSAGRHDAQVRHVFGADGALGQPGDPEPIGTTAAQGNGDGPPRWDHVHILGPASINSDTLFDTDVIPEPALEDQAVSGRVLGDGVILSQHVGNEYRLVVNANHDAVQVADDSHDVLPPDGTTPLWWMPDTSRLYAFISAKWHWISGKRYKATMSYHGDGNTIANDLPAVHTLNQFTADGDELATLSAGGTFTVPVAASNGVAYDGEWRVRWVISVGNLGATAGAAIELLLVAGGTTYVENLMSNAPNHSTIARGEETVTLAAGQTGLFQLSLDAAAGAKVLTGSRVEWSYLGPA